MLFVNYVLDDLLEHAITAILLSLDLDTLTIFIIYHTIKALMDIYHIDFDPLLLYAEEKLMNLIDLYHKHNKHNKQKKINHLTHETHVSMENIDEVISDTVISTPEEPMLITEVIATVAPIITPLVVAGAVMIVAVHHECSPNSGTSITAIKVIVVRCWSSLVPVSNLSRDCKGAGSLAGRLALDPRMPGGFECPLASWYM